MSSQCFALSPRDGLFVKDGRGWYTSDIGKSHSHPWPLPPTIRGALRAAYGHAFMEQHQKELSPQDWESQSEGICIHRLLTLRRPLDSGEYTHKHILWPTPADALYTGGKVQRLKPKALAHQGLGISDDPALNSLAYAVFEGEAKKPKPKPMFWPNHSMLAWLQGREPSDQGEGHQPSTRDDIHVTIDGATQSAKASLMFSSRVIEALDKDRHAWAIGLQCAFPDNTAWNHSSIPLGGRRRPALIQKLGDSLFKAPAEHEFQASKGLRLILATPAEFSEGWLPDGLRAEGNEYRGKILGMELKLKAAMVPRPLYLSTWDMVKKEARKTRTLVPAGAVYFFEKAKGEPFSPEDFCNAWLGSIGQHPEDGLGLVLPGLWNPQG